ncbi:MAG: LemA family protein, partial [Luminiphilus sp.]|nr:LemA family protein [Luminiphilus sp.]MDG2136710.1 LemA family protein [Luminiphilus sp.]
DELSLRLEKYPDLEGHQLLYDFNRRLITLENEIALIRAGFNDSVMNFNTRLQSFPDNLLAIAFKFERLTALQFDKKAHQLPAVDLQQKNS